MTYALEVLWVIGDDFMSSGIRILRETQTLRGTKPGLDSYTSMKTIHLATQTSFSTNDNALTKPLNTVIQSINTHNKVPRILIVVFDHNLVTLYQLADVVIAWLYQQINRNFRARIDHLPPWAKPAFKLPTVVMVKPITKPVWIDRDDKYKLQRRKVMKAMDRATIDYENLFTLHIDSILPTDDRFFDTTGKLNGRGYREFWLYAKN